MSREKILLVFTETTVNEQHVYFDHSLCLPLLTVVLELAIIAWKQLGGAKETGPDVNQGRRAP